MKTIKYLSITFDLYIYKSREKKFVNINNLIAEIRKNKRIEKQIVLNNSMKIIAFRKKWHLTDNLISITQMDCAQEILMKKQVDYMWKIIRKNRVGLFFMFCFCSIFVFVSFFWGFCCCYYCLFCFCCCFIFLIFHT